MAMISLYCPPWNVHGKLSLSNWNSLTYIFFKEDFIFKSFKLKKYIIGKTLQFNISIKFEYKLVLIYWSPINGYGMLYSSSMKLLMANQFWSFGIG